MPVASKKRRTGRPQAFRPEDALDRAVEMFWQYGYEGVDVERIAHAVHVTKPALYRQFGDKPTLLLKAVEHYAEQYGAPMLAAFLAEPDVQKAVQGFCGAAVDTATGDARSGCMMAAAVFGQSARVGEIRSFVAKGFAASADLVAQRFEQEITKGNLSAAHTAKTRSRALIDLMQGILLRAKVGIPREELLEDAMNYVQLVLS